MQYLFSLFLLSSVLYSTGCNLEPIEMPTEAAIQEVDNQDIPASYQLIYNTNNLQTPDPNQQRLRVLLWLDRMNCNISQLNQLEELRKKVITKNEMLKRKEAEKEKEIRQELTPIYNQIWDQMRQGQSLDAENLEPLMERLEETRLRLEKNSQLDIRLENIKSILDIEQNFLHALSPEQESTIVDALFFLRHILDPIGNPQDFSLLVGNTYEPGQYAILLKGTSELARNSRNIGGLWSDEPELTGRILHEAQREVILYLALLEPSLEEAIRAAKERIALSQ